MRGDISYWIFNYQPHWEAASKEAQTLLRAFDGQFSSRLFSLNLSRRLQLRGQEKYLPLPEALAALPIMYQIARGYRVNHLFSSAGERFLMPTISKRTSLLTICKEAASVDAFERNLRHLARFRYIVVENERHHEIMKQCGIEETKIKVIYPPTVVKPYQSGQPPFKILFASSPTTRNKLLSRGIFLILETARCLHNVEFILVWRKFDHDVVRDLIKDRRVNNVSVINGYVDDMGPLYDMAHMTILPGLDYSSFKPAPHSALESLGHGKPVLVTPTTSIVDIVAQRQCGIVFAPTVAGLEGAIREAMARYHDLQRNCQPAVDACFSRDVFLRKYRQLYEELLQNG